MPLPPLCSVQQGCAQEHRPRADRDQPVAAGCAEGGVRRQGAGLGQGSGNRCVQARRSWVGRRGCCARCKAAAAAGSSRLDNAAAQTAGRGWQNGCNSAGLAWCGQRAPLPSTAGITAARAAAVLRLGGTASCAQCPAGRWAAHCQAPTASCHFVAREQQRIGSAGLAAA